MKPIDFSSIKNEEAKMSKKTKQEKVKKEKAAAMQSRQKERNW